jgi:toxin ParE1/3/4
MPNPSLHPEAEEEYLDALRYYQRISSRLGKEFEQRAKELLKILGSTPKQFGWYDDDFRLALFGSFPYSLIYRERPGNIVQVIAVAHTSREPGYWKDRVS